MTAITEDITQYENKRVILVVSQDDEAVEIEGTVEKAGDIGILIKPKGKVKLDLYEMGQIEDIRLAPESSVKIKPSTIRPVKLGQARKHLLDRHGVTLTEVNKLTEEEAFAYHEGVDHVAEDLGHIHKDKSESPAAKAAAAAESEDED